MTGPQVPTQYPPFVVPQSEWDEAAKRRGELINELVNRLKLGGAIGQDNADAAANHHQIAGQNADGTPTTYQAVTAPPDQHELNQLLGAATVYGIENADKIPPQQLKSIINARRLGMQQKAGPVDDEKRVNDGMTSLGLGLTNQFLDVAEHLPMVGDLIARNKWIQGADASIARANEIVQSSNPPAEAAHAASSYGIGGFIGYTLPFEGALRLAGLAGKIGFIGANAARLSPITRAAVRFGTAQTILDSGRDMSTEQRMIDAGVAAGGGAAFEYANKALPALFNKVRSYFPTDKADINFPKNRIDPNGSAAASPEATDADWWYEHDDPQLSLGEKVLQLHPELAQQVEQRALNPSGAPQPAGLPQGQYEMPNPSIRLLGSGSNLPPGAEPAPRIAPPGTLIGPPRAPVVEDFSSYLSAVHDAAMVKNPARKFTLLADMTAPKTRAALVDLHANGVPVEQAAQFIDELNFSTKVGYAEPNLVPVDRPTAQEISLRNGTPFSLLEATPEEKVNYVNGLILAKKAATQDATQLTKQAVLMESGNVNRLLNSSAIGNADVAQTVTHKSPGSLNILQNVGDIGPTVSKLLQTPAGEQPVAFRVLSRNGRTDLAVTSGEPMSDSQAAQYEQHGLFTGQKAIAHGKEIVIDKPGATDTWVREPFGTRTYLVKNAHILPGYEATPTGMAEFDSQDLYEELKDYSDSQMAKVQKSMGLAEQPDWLSSETASQLPRFIDEFLAKKKLNSPAAKAVLQHSFEQQRTAEYRILSPVEAHDNTIIQNELREVQIAKPIENIPIEDLAATKGFFYKTYPDGVGGTLEDRSSSLNIPMKSQEEALEFLKHFNREVPDYTPSSEVPFELSHPGPGGSHAGNDMAPTWQGHEETHASAKKQLGRINRSLDYALSEENTKNLRFDQAPETPAEEQGDALLGPRIEPDRPEAPRESAIAEFLRRDTGTFYIGGGGGPASTTPPAPPGFTGGSGGPTPGAPIPPRGPTPPARTPPPPIPPSGSLGGQFAAKPPDQYYRTLQLLDSAWLRYADPFRSATLKLQKAMEADGLSAGTLWSDSDGLRVAMTKKHNDEHPWMSEASDILNEFRHQLLRKGTVTQIQSMTNPTAKQAAMATVGYRQNEIDSQNRLGDFYNRFFSDHLNLKQVDPSLAPRVYEYLNDVRFRQANPTNTDPYTDTNGRLPQGLQFVENALRGGGFQLKQLDNRTFTTAVIRAGMWNRYMDQPWTSMKAKWDDPRIPQKLRDIVNPWLDVVKTGVNPEYDIAIQGARRTLNRLGVPITDGEVHGIWNSVFSNMYRARLGGRPDVILRDSISPFLSGVQIGFQPIIKGYNDFLSGGAVREAMYQRAVDGGWLEEGMVRVPNADVFERPLQQAGQNLLPPNLQARRENLAGIGDALYDLIPKGLRSGIQGTKLDPMLLYTHLNEMNRVIAGDAGWQVATKALTEYKNQLLSNLNQPQLHAGFMDDLIDKSQADTYLKPIQDKFKALVDAGNYPEAANLLARESANSQFLYGAKEQPIGIRKLGTAGKMGMMYGSFSDQYVARMKEVFSSDVPGVKRAAAAARYATVTGILGAAGAYTGWNFDKWMWHTALSFAGGPMATGLYDSYQALSGHVAEATGQPLSPQQRDALARARRTTLGDDIAGGIAGVFPYTSTIQTANDVYLSGRGLNPVEAVSRRLITGQQGLGPDFKQWLDNQKIVIPPQGQFPIPVGPPNPGGGSRQ